MTVRIRTGGRRFFIPVPVSMAGLVARLLPESLFEEMRKNTPQPYRALVSREIIRMIFSESLDIIRENQGLEVVHVEAKDGTFVSIKL